MSDTPAGFYYSGAKINRNRIWSKGGATTGIRIMRAKACEAIGNVVSGCTLSQTTLPGIRMGETQTSGVHTAKDNVAGSYLVAGTPVLENNKTWPA